MPSNSRSPPWTNSKPELEGKLIGVEETKISPAPVSAAMRGLVNRRAPDVVADYLHLAGVDPDADLQAEGPRLLANAEPGPLSPSTRNFSSGVSRLFFWSLAMTASPGGSKL
jgi:hypothetical protein